MQNFLNCGEFLHLHFFSFCTRGGRLQICSSAIRTANLQTNLSKAFCLTPAIFFKANLRLLSLLRAASQKKESDGPGFPKLTFPFSFLSLFFPFFVRVWGKGKVALISPSPFPPGHVWEMKKEKDRKKRITSRCNPVRRLHWSNFLKKRILPPYLFQVVRNKRTHIQSPLLFLPAAIAGCCWGGGGDFFVSPQDDLVAQSDTNNLCRSQNSKNPDRLKFFSLTNQFRENHPKRFKLQI